MGHGAGYIFLDPEPDLNFWEKAGSEFGINGIWCIQNVCRSMVEKDTEPDSESKIWRLTGSRVLSLRSRIRFRSQFF